MTVPWTQLSLPNRASLSKFQFHNLHVIQKHLSDYGGKKTGGRGLWLFYRSDITLPAEDTSYDNRFQLSEEDPWNQDNLANTLDGCSLGKLKKKIEEHDQRFFLIRWIKRLFSPIEQWRSLLAYYEMRRIQCRVIEELKQDREDEVRTRALTQEECTGFQKTVEDCQTKISWFSGMEPVLYYVVPNLLKMLSPMLVSRESPWETKYKKSFNLTRENHGFTAASSSKVSGVPMGAAERLKQLQAAYPDHIQQLKDHGERAKEVLEVIQTRKTGETILRSLKQHRDALVKIYPPDKQHCFRSEKEEERASLDKFANEATREINKSYEETLIAIKKCFEDPVTSEIARYIDEAFAQLAKEREAQIQQMQGENKELRTQMQAQGTQLQGENKELRTRLDTQQEQINRLLQLLGQQSAAASSGSRPGPEFFTPPFAGTNQTSTQQPPSSQAASSTASGTGNLTGKK